MQPCRAWRVHRFCSEQQWGKGLVRTREEEGVVRISCRVLLWLEQGIKVPKAARISPCRVSGCCADKHFTEYWQGDQGERQRLRSMFMGLAI